MNKRVFVESLMVALLLMALTIGWKIVQGYYLTKSLLNEFPSEHMTISSESTVSFGVNDSLSLDNTLLLYGGILLIAALYYTIRNYAIKSRTK